MLFRLYLTEIRRHLTHTAMSTRRWPTRPIPTSFGPYHMHSSTVRCYSQETPPARDLSFLASIQVAVTSAFAAFRDPTRQDMVAALGESTGPPFLSQMRNRMLIDPIGRKILRIQPIINTFTLPSSLSSLPHNTFGYHYANFLSSHSVSPDTRAPVRYLSNPELNYVMTRYRQIHDFWHTLLGLGISVEEELALKWFELVQTGLPVCALSSFVGPLRLNNDERERLFRTYVPWAIQCASNSRFMMNVMYEELFERDLDEPKPKRTPRFKITELEKNQKKHLIPGPYRWSIVPHKSFGDGYVFPKGVGPKATNKAIRAAFMKNPSKGRLLDEVFLLPLKMLAKSRYVLDDSPRRYVRTSSFLTNGLVFSMLWIYTTCKPPPLDRKVEDAINLPNKNKTLRLSHKKAWIIRLDLGAIT
ncbi:hypothetical protein SeMB42_g01466 [Synchytrium endobioticum]|uniref:4-hydroxy-3-methoxy-5-polyprenylbenzoate decarboxylase n=1 Tax=Synchytrium endobioticum TaxID=286115 RepID=A0A507DEG4_9FUNG|nr:hypothetical protein SeLEV6574_g01207 [Synchytrium endobioticum]TPX52346.1 hypothetical protein SeMB42_g01466 [Synchytrium endobioticum]